MIKIIPFQKEYQDRVNLLIDEIAKEFPYPISLPYPNAKNKLLDRYWVALEGDMVIGTIAILRIENNHSILKKMFVNKRYRGKEQGVSSLLLSTLFRWCEEEKISTIFLGTMLQFKRAHRFYEKHGFQNVPLSELPVDFIRNPVDDIFYRKNLLPTDES